MDGIDWVQVYARSAPLLKAFQIDAIRVLCMLGAFFIALIAFSYGLMRKYDRTKPSFRLVLGLVAFALIVFVKFGRVFSHFGDPYALECVVDRKWVHTDGPRLGIRVKRAVAFSAFGRGPDLPRKTGKNEIRATIDLYDKLEQGQSLVLLVKSDDEAFGQIRDGKIIVPMPARFQ